MTRYLTLAYGDQPDVYRQSAMLLVSLLAHAPAPCELVVATDRPERFAWFGEAVRLVTLERRELESWRGSPAISMRVKLEAIRANWPGSGAIALIEHCPHGPDDACDCRKPLPGLFRRIATHFRLSDLRGVPAVGDSRRDLEAGLALGADPFLVRTGKGQRTLEKPLPSGTQVFDDLAAVADHLLETRP